MGVGHERSSKHWRFTHNFMHHKYTNILGMDDDVGYGVIRRSPGTSRWKPFNLYGNLLFNTLLAIGFEWGVGLQHLEIGKIFKGPRQPAGDAQARLREFGAKAGSQVFKDYVAYPAVTSLSPRATYRSTLTANAVANVIRNVWANAVIFCGHFPTAQTNSPRPTWSVRAKASGTCARCWAAPTSRPARRCGS